MHDLMAICHAAPKGGYNGSHWSTRRRAFYLLDSILSIHVASLLGDLGLLATLARNDVRRAAIRFGRPRFDPAGANKVDSGAIGCSIGEEFH